MFDNRVGNCREAEDKLSTPLRLTMFTADQRLQMENDAWDADGNHASMFAMPNGSAPAPDLSDDLTVEFLEMVRNWKRADDEHEHSEQARDIVEAPTSLSNVMD
jgi:hypothetical protein